MSPEPLVADEEPTTSAAALSGSVRALVNSRPVRVTTPSTPTSAVAAAAAQDSTPVARTMFLSVKRSAAAGQQKLFSTPQPSPSQSNKKR
jgi:hypothetical protein